MSNDQSNEQHDTEAHVYIPKDERAGAQDTEAHGFKNALKPPCRYGTVA